MILAILQARLSSTRLPGKVLKKILGVPMLQLQLERLGRVKKVDKLLVATSDRPEDRELFSLCENIGIDCFRGSLDDVLDRFYRAAGKYKPEHIVRLTGDCPLTEPEVIDRVIEYHLKGRYEYTATGLEPTFPHGVGAEIMRFEILERAWLEAKLPSEREHVTPYIWKRPNQFKIGRYKNNDDLSHYRWTVDEPEDFEFVTCVYEALYPQKPDFNMVDILELLKENPELTKINAAFSRNEGYLRSLEKDKCIEEE